MDTVEQIDHIRRRVVTCAHENRVYIQQTQPDENLVYEYNKEVRNNPRLNPRKNYLGEIPKILLDAMVKRNPDLKAPDKDIRRKAWFREMLLNPEVLMHSPSALKKKPGESRRASYFVFK